MGNCSSKGEENASAPSAPSHAHAARPNACAESDASAPHRPQVKTQHSLTKSGFHSDIHNDKKSMASLLAHNNTKRLRDVYETQSGAVLGRGACGTVSVVKRKDTGELYAMKQVSLDGMAGGTVEELRKEIDIQRNLTHPNICRLFESFEEDGNIFIIMEVCI